MALGRLHCVHNICQLIHCGLSVANVFISLGYHIVVDVVIVWYAFTAAAQLNSIPFHFGSIEDMMRRLVCDGWRVLVQFVPATILCVYVISCSLTVIDIIHSFYVVVYYLVRCGVVFVQSCRFSWRGVKWMWERISAREWILSQTSVCTCSVLLHQFSLFINLVVTTLYLFTSDSFVVIAV